MLILFMFIMVKLYSIHFSVRNFRLIIKAQLFIIQLYFNCLVVLLDFFWQKSCDVAVYLLKLIMLTQLTLNV